MLPLVVLHRTPSRQVDVELPTSFRRFEGESISLYASRNMPELKSDRLPSN